MVDKVGVKKLSGERIFSCDLLLLLATRSNELSGPPDFDPSRWVSGGYLPIGERHQSPAGSDHSSAPAGRAASRTQVHHFAALGRRRSPLIAVGAVPDRRCEPIPAARQRLVPEVRPADLRIKPVAAMLQPADPACGRRRLRRDRATRDRSRRAGPGKCGCRASSLQTSRASPRKPPHRSPAAHPSDAEKCRAAQCETSHRAPVESLLVSSLCKGCSE